MKDLTRKKKEEREKQTVSIDMTETLEIGTMDTRNVGYGILKFLYRDLEPDKFWNWKTRGSRAEYSVDQLFRLLAIARPLHPGSKCSTLNHKNIYFENFGDFSLDDIYHAPDVIAEHREALRTWIFEHSKKLCERDLSTSYFDCTNYNFDIGRPDVDILNEEGVPVDSSGNAVPVRYRNRGPGFPAGRILESLKNYNCTHLDSNRWQFTYYDGILDACASAFNVRLNMKYRTQQELRRLLRY